MKAQDAVNKIKELLGLEVKLASMKLEDGAVIEAEAFEAGNEIFVVTEEDRIALPVGTYTLEDGRALVIEEEGLIASIGEAADESEEEEELKEDKMEYASKEEMAEVKAAISELKDAIEAMMPKEEEKEEMSSETEETKEEEKEELSAVVEETRETFHSPESNVEKKVFKLGARAYKGTQDMIFEKLFNK